MAFSPTTSRQSKYERSLTGSLGFSNNGTTACPEDEEEEEEEEKEEEEEEGWQRRRRRKISILHNVHVHVSLFLTHGHTHTHLNVTQGVITLPLARTSRRTQVEKSIDGVSDRPGSS